MGQILVAWLLGVAVTGVAPGEPAAERFQFTQMEMAVPIKIVLYSEDASTASRAAEAAFARIHQLNAVLSDYDPESELRRLCRSTGSGGYIAVSEDLWQVLNYAQAVAERSDGAFDVTIGPVVRLWRRARRNGQLPTPEQLASARALVGRDLLKVDSEQRSAALLKHEMRLDLGGIAKGYAIDKALEVLEKFGIKRALVDAGGDIVLGDPPPDRPGWQIGIARLEVDGPPTRVLTLSNTAIATSGDSWQFVEIDGRRYSHIVDPRTGLGLTDHSSVTIIARDGMVADALASAVSVLGPEQGMKLIGRTTECAALIVRSPHGQIETYQSQEWTRLAGEAAAGKPAG